MNLFEFIQAILWCNSEWDGFVPVLGACGNVRFLLNSLLLLRWDEAPIYTVYANILCDSSIMSRYKIVRVWSRYNTLVTLAFTLMPRATFLMFFSLWTYSGAVGGNLLEDPCVYIVVWDRSYIFHRSFENLSSSVAQILCIRSRGRAVSCLLFVRCV